jgi:hypothetical protein
MIRAKLDTDHFGMLPLGEMIVSNIELKGPALPNIPWEERPHHCNEVVWRSEKKQSLRAMQCQTRTVYSTAPSCLLKILLANLG